MSITLNLEWYEVKLTDESALSGRFVAEFLQLVIDTIDAKLVVVEYLSGANVQALNVNYTSKIVSIGPVMELVAEAKQFDWCDFFLFCRDGFIPDEAEQYEDIIRRTDATVRAVDNTYLYLYTKDEIMKDRIAQEFNDVEIVSGKLNTFNFPE